jgi:hypothetical protein
MDIDPIVMVNLIFCIIILALGITAYIKMKRMWPILIGVAFGLFGVTHLFNILDIAESLQALIIVLRIIGYGLVLTAAYWYGCRKFASEN